MFVAAVGNLVKAGVTLDECHKLKRSNLNSVMPPTLRANRNVKLRMC